MGKRAAVLALATVLVAGCWTLKPGTDFSDGGPMSRDAVATDTMTAPDTATDAGILDAPTVDTSPSGDVVATDAAADIVDVLTTDTSPPVDVGADAGACMPCVFGTSLIGHCCLM